MAKELSDRDSKLDNSRRRVLYSNLELLKLDLFESALDSSKSGPHIENTFLRIDELLKALKLVPVVRKRFWWSPLEVRSVNDMHPGGNCCAYSLYHFIPHLSVFKLQVVLRFAAVSCSFMLVGSFCSLPLLFLRAMDQYLQRDAFKYWSEAFKRHIAW